MKCRHLTAAHENAVRTRRAELRKLEDEAVRKATLRVSISKRDIVVYAQFRWTAGEGGEA
jgi:hypothetical protein